MKIPQKLLAVFTALLIIPIQISPITVNASSLEEESTQYFTSAPDDETEREEGNSSQESTTGEEPHSEDELPEKTTETVETTETEIPLACDTALSQETTTEPEEESDIPLPDEAPMFTAYIEYSSQGYRVKGTFTDFTSDLCHIQPLYSLDEKNWQTGKVEWDLEWLDTEDENERKKLENQVCLYDSHEPLKSYLAGTLDRFCLKLRLTKKNGLTYDSQAVTIDRGKPQTIPEDCTPVAVFASSMRLLDRNPFRVYGKYQITIHADSSAEDAAALLPDTLPIEVQIPLQNDISHTAICTVDCPVSWKPLSVPLPAAGESVTIPDAANELVIPAGTLLKTPLGIFRLDKALSVDQDPIQTDEVRLVFNAVPEDGNPTGVLVANKDLLEMSFYLKPTGATAIRVYTCSEGGKKWKEISGHSLLEAVNAQPSTANSGYASVLDSSQEPYRSYLEAVNAGNDPVPFFVGLKIKGGVYDGRQLILAWPADYELPLDLPELGGSGGNHGNAGSDDKDDSTDEGQRPNLPQNPENEPDTTAKSDLPQNQQPQQNTELYPDVTAAIETYTDKSPEKPLMTAQPAADNTAKEPSPAADSIMDTEPDIPTETAVQSAPPAKAKASSVIPPSDKNADADTLEMTAGNAENSSHNYLLLAMAAAIAGIYLVLSIRRTNKK